MRVYVSARVNPGVWLRESGRGHVCVFYSGTIMRRIYVRWVIQANHC